MSDHGSDDVAVHSDTVVDNLAHTQVISMSPEPTGHAKYPICSYEGSWAPDQMEGSYCRNR